ncbi:hypothetical protein [Bacillus atrophaeus]|nr:hypothetical protein [Bacillus atrophaeus]EIM12318.1 hypothetical protein UY9_03541 [Bacillus atrophaeus C89]MDR4397178.1 hypothetical protein [Bacillus atrophaeus]MEC2036540.1 hypothetical protein [Bacillus atrophaeus]MEC2359778.1 hypothetical protein [Bacillus atrophaeus]MEC2361793.1 hypothetical protein [Bacillus atrophaeus]
MDCFEFIERVEGSLLWHEYQLDEQLNNQAWFTANLMMASGNMKKSTDALKLKKGLYKSLEDLEEESKTKVTVKKDYEDEKAKLLGRFGLDESQLNS